MGVPDWVQVKKIYYRFGGGGGGGGKAQSGSMGLKFVNPSYP